MSVDDVEESIKLFPRSTWCFRAGIRSVLATPMIADGRAIGIIRWQNFDGDAYEEIGLELAERVANQMAGAMANTQIFAENQRNQLGLRENETQYRQRYHDAPIAYISTDAAGIIAQANDRASDLFGYALEELVGGSVMALYADTPDGIEKAWDVLGEASGRSSAELEYLCADGKQFWAVFPFNKFQIIMGKRWRIKPQLWTSKSASLWNCNWRNPRKWRPSGNWQAVSPTISTIS